MSPYIGYGEGNQDGQEITDPNFADPFAALNVVDAAELSIPSTLSTSSTSSTRSIPSVIPTFNLLCGVAALAATFTSNLANLGFHQDKASPLQLVVDMQLGFALDCLERLEKLEKLEKLETPPAQATDRAGRTDIPNLRPVVVTFSACPEYLQDLWDLQPNILIVDTKHEYDFGILGTAMAAAARGEHYRMVPRAETSLDASERAVLSYLARGWSNKEIAERLHTHDKTVMNTLTTIYRTLGVKSRAEAILYYWDLWYSHRK